MKKVMIGNQERIVDKMRELADATKDLRRNGRTVDSPAVAA